MEDNKALKAEKNIVKLRIHSPFSDSILISHFIYCCMRNSGKSSLIYTVWLFIKDDLKNIKMIIK